VETSIGRSVRTVASARFDGALGKLNAIAFGEPPSEAMARRRKVFGAACGVCGMVAAACYALIAHQPIAPLIVQQSQATGGEDDDAAKADRAQMMERVRYRGGEYLFAAYGGSPYTHASDLRIERGGAEMTVHDVDWQGKAFDDPIYYGIRIARWLPGRADGVMLDFMHSKAYAPLDQRVKLSGGLGGQQLPEEAAVGDVFHKLEFTHGHNLLTLNWLRRLPSLGATFSPYVGGGLGVALPHTEVQMKGLQGRTYAYQYAGPAVQFVVGLEIRVPRLSYFVEYKFTSADYRVPLQNFDGSALPLDLWAQFTAWLRGEEPVRGWASTRLTSHQIIAGMGVRTVPQGVAAP